MKAEEYYNNCDEEMKKDVPQIIRGYIMANKDTIFKEELEKRLPSAEEILEMATNASDIYVLEEDIKMCKFDRYEGAKWLIQYLKNK